MRTAKRFKKTILWDWAAHEVPMRNTKRDETYDLDCTPCEAPSLVLSRAEEKLSMAHPRQGVWAATTTIALVTREKGSLRCCMLTP